MTLQSQIGSIKFKEGGYLHAQEEYVKRYVLFKSHLEDSYTLKDLKKIFGSSFGEKDLADILNIDPKNQHLQLKDFLEGKYLSEDFKEKIIKKK